MVKWVNKTQRKGVFPDQGKCDSEITRYIGKDVIWHKALSKSLLRPSPDSFA